MSLPRPSNVSLSHTESLDTSPFRLRQSDINVLNASEAFQSFRKTLASQVSPTFCTYHQPTSPTIRETWLLHRDITHALLLPIRNIQTLATETARQILCHLSLFDLELAFTAEARGTFSWLQCLLLEEEDWCHTSGCPACTTLHTLTSEPTTRLLLASARLSRSLHTLPNTTPLLRLSPSSTPLPPLDFFRSTLRRALDTDPWWGPQHARDIEAKAAGLEEGILALVEECADVGGGLGVGEVGKGEGGLRKWACPTPWHVHEKEGVVVGVREIGGLEMREVVC